MDTIGTRLRETRESAGKSQEAFGALAGVGKRAQINYEQGLRLPDADYLARIAAAGCDVLYVITGQHGSAKASVSAVAEPEPPLSDRDRLRVAVEAVEEGLAETRRKLPPDKRAELFLAAYDLIAEMAEPEQSRANVIRLVRVAA